MTLYVDQLRDEAWKLAREGRWDYRGVKEITNPEMTAPFRWTKARNEIRTFIKENSVNQVKGEIRDELLRQLPFAVMMAMKVEADIDEIARFTVAR